MRPPGLLVTANELIEVWRLADTVWTWDERAVRATQMFQDRSLQVEARSTAQRRSSRRPSPVSPHIGAHVTPTTYMILAAIYLVLASRLHTVARTWYATRPGLDEDEQAARGRGLALTRTAESYMDAAAAILAAAATLL